ncbi:MAG: hypothetical protein HQL95_04630 [Magnetococcales bacterium]|nr:hypothetical protein [Magnetococcales bacterium]
MDNHLIDIATQILTRQSSVQAYQTNIDTFTLILDQSPQGPVPPEVEPYMGMRAGELPVEMDESLVETVFAYQHRNDMIRRIRAEKQQKTIEQSVIEALTARIPADLYDQAMQEATARQGPVGQA